MHKQLSRHVNYRLFISLPARKASSAWVGVSVTRVSANFTHLLRARTGMYRPVDMYRTKFLLISSSSGIAGSSLPLDGL